MLSTFSQIAGSLWGSIDFWRVFWLLPLLLLLGYVLKTPVTSLLANRSRKKHDLVVYKRSDARMSQKDLRALVSSLGGDICYLHQWSKLRSYLEFFRLEEDRYVDRRLSKTNAKLIKELSDLEVFILEHFFTDYSVRGERMLGMHPEMRNGDGCSRREDSGKYLKCQVELYSILDRLFETHRIYVKAVHARLRLHESRALMPPLITRTTENVRPMAKGLDPADASV
jgi:hypothetical protein